MRDELFCGDDRLDDVQSGGIASVELCK